MSNAFRIQGKCFFLTYPKSGDVTGELLSEHIRAEWSPAYGLVATELHDDGEPHLHAVVRFDKRRDIRNARYFDFMGAHCNIQRCKDVQHSIRYCKKDGNFIEWGYANCTEALQEQVEAITSYRELLRWMVTSEQIHRSNFWREYWRATVGGEDAPVKALESFYDVIDETPAFQWDSGKTCLVLVGPSGIGKTQYIRSKYEGAHLVSSSEDLKSFEPGQTLLFDDFSLANFSRSSIIFYLDVETTRSLRVLYGTVRVPFGTKRVFTCNSLYDLLGDKQSDQAILRRITILNVTNLIR